MSQFARSPDASRFVVVANRLPVHRESITGDAPGRGTEWHRSPGGLVSALAPILEESHGTWVGWAGSADDAPEPFEHSGIRNVALSLSDEEVSSFYEGFSNRTLWPLYHDAVRQPEFRRRWWWPYVEINRRFAQRAAEEAAEGALVWVQDYHLQLVPGMLRRERPDLRIGFFLHIPFPPQELFSQLPWRKAILEGLLGADLFGCQTELGAQNFAQLAVRYAGAEVADGALHFEGRRIRYGAFPISIDSNRYAAIAARDAVRARAEEIRRELGGRRIVLGVDRLDYTKGIDIRLRAWSELLERGDVSPKSCVLVQTAVPSREGVADYQEQREEVERLVGRINGDHGRLGQVAIHYLHTSLDVEELVALYLAADVMLVTPLRDGMNLVAKEYVATRLDDSGVLVLSEFTGAAHELEDALLVNPHDLDGLATTIREALELPAGEVARRMAAMRRWIHEHDVYRWAESFSSALQA